MKSVHQKVLALAEKEREITEALLVLLRQIERERWYLDKGVPSLHKYCTKILKYSEGSATRRVNASRLLADVPSALDGFREGSLNLSHLSLAQSFIQSQEKASGTRMSLREKRSILSKIEGRTQDEARRILQNELPQAPVGRESTRIVNGETEIKFLADADFMAKLEAVRAKNAHCPEFAAIATSFKALLERELTRGRNARGAKRTNVRIAFARAKDQCEHEDEYGRCKRTHHLQIDHIIPRAKGGTDNLSNLQVLCRAHNLKKGARSST